MGFHPPTHWGRGDWDGDVSRSRGKCWCSAGSDNQSKETRQKTHQVHNERRLQAKSCPSPANPCRPPRRLLPKQPAGLHSLPALHTQLHNWKGQAPGKLFPEWRVPNGPTCKEQRAGGRPTSTFIQAPSASSLAIRGPVLGVRCSKPSGLHHKYAHLQMASRLHGAYQGALLKGLCVRLDSRLVPQVAGGPNELGAPAAPPLTSRKPREVLLRRKVPPTLPSEACPQELSQQVPRGPRSPGLHRAGRDQRVVSPASCPVQARGHPTSQQCLGWGPHHLVG